MTTTRPSIFKRKYLLNLRFQLKYTLVFILLSSIVAGILGVRLFATVRENSQLITMDNSDANDAIQGQLREQDLKVLYEIVALLAGMVGAIAVVGIVVTHQVAGPSLVLTRQLNELASGRLPKLRPLRKNDELRDLHEAVHAAIQKLESEVDGDVATLERAVAACASNAELAPVHDELKQMLERLRGYRASE